LLQVKMCELCTDSECVLSIVYACGCCDGKRVCSITQSRNAAGSCLAHHPSLAKKAAPQNSSSLSSDLALWWWCTMQPSRWVDAAVWTTGVIRNLYASAMMISSTRALCVAYDTPLTVISAARRVICVTVLSALCSQPRRHYWFVAAASALAAAAANGGGEAPSSLSSATRNACISNHSAFVTSLVS
jgi:hypothetical protein